jgi:acetyl-CoA carboxylase biotin carboxyl carrier protein
MAIKKKVTKSMAIDEAAIRKLANLMEEKNLTEVEVTEDSRSIRVSRATKIQQSTDIVNQPKQVLSEPLTHSESHLDDFNNAVTSPMVGVIYTRPEPNSSDFISVGDTLQEGDTLFLIEAMKVFNPIIAQKTGKVGRILVTNGTPVEYGEPLVIIE